MATVQIKFSKPFKKQFGKIPKKIQTKFWECLDIFLLDQYDIRLRNHSLKGSWQGFRSIDITGDWRAVYELVDSEHTKFHAIGTHSQLYG